MNYEQAVAQSRSQLSAVARSLAQQEKDLGAKIAKMSVAGIDAELKKLPASPTTVIRSVASSSSRIPARTRRSGSATSTRTPDAGFSCGAGTSWTDGLFSRRL